MLPAERSQFLVFSLFRSLTHQIQKWIHQEIVDDDPWDEDSQFPEA